MGGSFPFVTSNLPSLGDQGIRQNLTEGKRGGVGVFNLFSNIKKDPNNMAVGGFVDWGLVQALCIQEEGVCLEDLLFLELHKMKNMIGGVEGVCQGCGRVEGKGVKLSFIFCKNK